jgi:hypothetical protein
MPNSAQDADARTTQDIEENPVEDKPKRVTIWRRPWVIPASFGFFLGALVGVVAVVVYDIKKSSGSTCGESTGEWSTF